MLPGRSLRAYLARLRNASISEAAYRVRQAVRIRGMRGNFLTGTAADISIPVEAAAVDDLQMPVFGLQGQNSGAIEDILAGMVFHLSPEREEVARFERETRESYFADIRTPSSSPDIREVWEPGRLQHLTVLFTHLGLCSEPIATAAIKDYAQKYLLAWLRANPFLSGPHFMSPMECGLRIPVFFYSLKILDNLVANERREIVKALFLHAWWVSRNLSLHSSLGNHTVCECIGLVFAGSVFRNTPDGEAWFSRGLILLEQELSHQILEDGGPAEQSLTYHRFVLDLFWLVSDFLERNRLADCSEWQPRLLLGEHFMAAFQDESGAMPAIGDSDNGWAIAPGASPCHA